METARSLSVHVEQELDAIKVLSAGAILGVRLKPLYDNACGTLKLAGTCCAERDGRHVFGANAVIRLMCYECADGAAGGAGDGEVAELIALEAACRDGTELLKELEARMTGDFPLGGHLTGADAVICPAAHAALSSLPASAAAAFPKIQAYVEGFEALREMDAARKSARGFINSCFCDGGLVQIELCKLFRTAVAKAFPTLAGRRAYVSRCKEYKFGDFEFSHAMAFHAALRGVPGASASPRACAEAILKELPENDVIDKSEVVGPGYINLRLKNEYIAGEVRTVALSGARPPPPARTLKIAVDFSSPNIAKEMHVGHLRSTIIGDTISRILEFSGHEVLRLNHVGDWGTQFGMLITYLRREFPDFLTNPPNIADLTTFYKASKKAFDESEEFKDTSRKTVVELQSGNEECLAAWRMLCDVSRKEFQKVYDRLHVELTECGESFYNDKIPVALQEMDEKGLLKISDGATICFLDGFQIPLIVKKSDGGYGYDSTDMAAISYRLRDLHCDEIIYVTDAGQELHFRMVIAAAQAAGWIGPGKRVDHVGFGVVQGDDGKKFKTRSGETVRLVDLLDEAVRRMEANLRERKAEGKCLLSDEEIHSTAAAIGYGAVKYFDLRQNPATEYIFSYERMLDTRGNTAVYILFAYARIQSILRKALEADEAALDFSAFITLEHDAERQLSFTLLQFEDVISQFQGDLVPTRICDLLYSLAVRFSDFVTNCRVLQSPEQASRLLLCTAVKSTMKTCLELLGITPIDRI